MSRSRSIRRPSSLELAGLTLALAFMSHPAFGQNGDKALGQYLSAECVTCHQLSGQFEGIPPIIGWPEASFIEIMNEYRTKTRENPIMQTITGRLSPEQIAALAAYFGSLSAGPANEPANKESAKGRRRQ